MTWTAHTNPTDAHSALTQASIDAGTTPSTSLGGLLHQLASTVANMIAEGIFNTSIKVGGGTAITKIRTFSQALDVASVAQNTTAEQTFTVTGLTTADKVFVNKPSASAGLGIVNARVSATDTLAITFVNATGSGIDPSSETYTIVAIRS